MTRLADRPAGLDAAEMDRLFEAVGPLHILVIGDLALDVYWTVQGQATGDPPETRCPFHAVDGERLEAGAACNLAKNLAAIGIGRVSVCGVIGDDPWGRELDRRMQESAITTSGVVVQSPGWATPTHLRRYQGKTLVDRQDFGVHNVLSAQGRDLLHQAIAREVPRADLIVVYQKFAHGIVSPELLAQVRDLAGPESRVPRVASVRRADRVSLEGYYVKTDAASALEMAGVGDPAECPVGHDNAARAGLEIAAGTRMPVVVTRGPRGALLVEGDQVTDVPSVQVVGPADPLGAGDALLAALCAGLAAGYSPVDSLYAGVFAASVAVQKRNSTGVPTRGEIRHAADQQALIHHPELADDPRKARFVQNTEFERVESRLPEAPIRYAIFDHDGTISTLREGWEEVMEPVMIRCILGPAHDEVDDAVFLRIQGRVREYIDQTTGIQTLVQMQGLVRMVREFRFVPGPQILDEVGYKEIYNQALMTRVRERMQKLQRGELDVTDFTIKNAVPLLHALRNAGVTLYLASGTDEGDVKNEARALGYADLFNGGIFGATRDASHEAKRAVLHRIIGEIGTEQAGRVATLGDGPVEMREARKHGGFAVGLASDEVRRFGWNPAKRSRLIRAGAHLILPDFSQYQALNAILAGDGETDRP